MFTRYFTGSKIHFKDLTENQILALAISSEEDDRRIYQSYANGLREEFPDTAKIFDDMAEEEDTHRQWLIDLFREKFGETIPLIRREHVAGFYSRKPNWLVEPFGLKEVRKQAANMEEQAYRFYMAATKQVKDASIRKLLGDLAAAESNHINVAQNSADKHLTDEVLESEEEQENKQFVLTYVQPGLAEMTV